jgi:FKBP-type peptidyl-prolyl cis-trans isomerase SlyD
VMEVVEGVVVVDFNPPLAGKTLTFDVQVLTIRQADPDEVDHGHPHSLNSFYEEDEEEEEE